MKTKKNTMKVILFKNDILMLLMFIAVVLIALYLFKWYQVKSDEKVSKSYLIKNNLVTNSVTTFEELDDVLTENSSRLILYISYRNSHKIYNIEKKYKDLFQDYNLQEIFTLFDITNIKEDNKNYNKLINDFLDINVTGYPVVIYFENGQISSYKKINSYKDLERIIKKYNIEKNSH